MSDLRKLLTTTKIDGGCYVFCIPYSSTLPDELIDKAGQLSRAVYVIKKLGLFHTLQEVTGDYGWCPSAPTPEVLFSIFKTKRWV